MPIMDIRSGRKLISEVKTLENCHDVNASYTQLHVLTVTARLTSSLATFPIL